MNTRRMWVVVLLVAAFGCKRTPEDLEQWRNAQGGYEKMVEWAKSSEESEDVRVRAVQILIEEHQPNTLQPLLDAIADEALRARLVDGALPTVQAMWAKKDWPEIDPSKGGLQRVEGRSSSVTAKDAAYFLQPHASDATKAALESIMIEWMGEDQDVRDQLGSTTLAQIAPRAGAGATEKMLSWLDVTKQQSAVIDKILAASEDSKDDKVLAVMAEAVRKRCDAEHPNLSIQTEVAMLKIEHPTMIPYLERAITDPESPTKLIDAAMDSYVRQMKERAGPLFSKLIAEKSGLLRWVSATRMIEVRGQAGALAAANALPLEASTYSMPEDDSFKKESEIFCNFVNSELREQDVDPKPVVEQFLASSRWPVKTLGVICVRTTGSTDLSAKIQALVKDKTPIPGWGKPMTLGQVASETLASL